MLSVYLKFNVLSKNVLFLVDTDTLIYIETNNSSYSITETHLLKIFRIRKSYTEGFLHLYFPTPPMIFNRSRNL